MADPRAQHLRGLAGRRPRRQGACGTAGVDGIAGGPLAGDALKEEAAERAAQIRNARRRDERRAQREADRENRADRVSRADLAKAQDGRVGAQIRFVTEKPKDERRKKDKPEPQDEHSTNVLDRLGY